MLERHVGRFRAGARILAPLSGKSLDLGFLEERGHPVIGVELVEEAVAAFFTEAGRCPEIDRSGRHPVYREGRMELVVADFFQTTPRQLGRIDAVYDRAALIALPADRRARYAAHLASLLPHDTGILMVTVDYDPKEISGPPFSVPPSEIEAIFGGPFEIFPLETVAVEPPPNLAARGLTRLREHALWLRRRG